MALKGIKVIEIAGLAPGPFCGMLLSDFGANVIRVERLGQQQLDSLRRGKRTASIDLKHDKGKTVLRKLCSNADVLIEPFRPGVMERLGLGPVDLMKENERLIYARLTGFGQDGPHSRRAGHDLNYLAISGVLSLITSGGKPCPPMNMLADFGGGGMTCAMGILMALIERQCSNKGQIVDTSMVEGTRYLSSYLWHTKKSEEPASQFLWPNKERKEANVLDGGAHFYTVYKTKDDKWMSVAAIEPQFYAALLDALDLDEQNYPQFDIDKWGQLKEKLSAVFMSKTQAGWTSVFSNVDACVEPILELNQAEENDKLTTRPSFNSDHTPRPAPILSRTPAEPKLDVPVQNEHTAEILRELGYSDKDIINLSFERVIDCTVEAKL